MCYKIDFERRLLFDHVTELEYQKIVKEVVSEFQDCTYTPQKVKFFQFLPLCPAFLCFCVTSIPPKPFLLPSCPCFSPASYLTSQGPICDLICAQTFGSEVTGKCLLSLCLSTHPGRQNLLMSTQSHHTMKTSGAVFKPGAHA